MKTLHKILVALLIAGGGVAVAASDTRTEPYVAYDEVGPDRCLPTDKEAPCPGRLLRVKNPTKRAVTVLVTCGPELLLDAEATIPGGKTVVFDLGTNKPGGLLPGQCYLGGWTKR